MRVQGRPYRWPTDGTRGNAARRRRASRKEKGRGRAGVLEKGEGDASKRLLSTLWKTLEEEGYDVVEMQAKVRDTIRKAVITMEPYLIHAWH